MGWDFGNRDAAMSDMDFFSTELAPHKVLAVSNHRGEQAVYMAVRMEGGHQDGHVLGLVALYEGSGGDWYGYKLIEEGCGPAAENCPPAILDLLSPVEALYPPATFGREHAALWREACRRNWERR